MGRRFLKLSLTESTVDWIEGSKNPETCALCARKFGCQLVGGVSVSVPGQCQPPSLDSTLSIMVSGGAEFDVLIRTTIRHRKDPLYPFVKPLGKRFQVFGGFEFGRLQFVWLRIERSVTGCSVRTHLGPSLLPSL